MATSTAFERRPVDNYPSAAQQYIRPRGELTTMSNPRRTNTALAINRFQAQFQCVLERTQRMRQNNGRVLLGLLKLGFLLSASIVQKDSPKSHSLATTP